MNLGLPCAGLKALAIVLVIAACGCFTLILFLLLDESPIVFESAESSASPHGSIYNRVTWISSWNRDIWFMQQSQSGWNENFNTWDRLVIDVDKNERPYRATFTQSVPGAVPVVGPLPSVEYGVSCQTCHSNGPRGIRPVYDVPTNAPVSTWNRLRVALWNLRIASYGRTLSVAAPLSSGAERRIPLSQASLGRSFKPLQAKACALCHNDTFSFARGSLSRENAPSIHFLVERGLMPPPGFFLSGAEKESILRFSQ